MYFVDNSVIITYSLIHSTHYWEKNQSLFIKKLLKKSILWQSSKNFYHYTRILIYHFAHYYRTPVLAADSVVFLSCRHRRWSKKKQARLKLQIQKPNILNGYLSRDITHRSTPFILKIFVNNYYTAWKELYQNICWQSVGKGQIIGSKFPRVVLPVAPKAFSIHFPKPMCPYFVIINNFLSNY